MQTHPLFFTLLHMDLLQEVMTLTRSLLEAIFCMAQVQVSSLLAQISMSQGKIIKFSLMLVLDMQLSSLAVVGWTWRIHGWCIFRRVQVLAAQSQGNPLSVCVKHFVSAGAYFIIATHRPAEDSAFKIFSTHFYSTSCSRRGGIHPSETLASAKQKMIRQ